MDERTKLKELIGQLKDEVADEHYLTGYMDRLNSLDDDAVAFIYKKVTTNWQRSGYKSPAVFLMRIFEHWDS